MKRKINIKSKKLVLSDFQEDDISDKYLSWLNDPEVVQFSRQRFINHDFLSSKKYFESFVSSNNLFISIKLHKVNKMIGTMTVYFSEPNNADIGILVGDKSEWGKGYGKDAWNTLLIWLENELNIAKITAGTLSSNIGMLKVFRESGMSLESAKNSYENLNNKAVDVLYFSRFKNKKISK